METGLYFEEYVDGWTLESEPASVTEQHIDAFVELHDFRTPTYTDRDYMSAAYGGRMSPGLLVLSMAEGLVLNTGITRRRGIFLIELTPKFRRPVYAGDIIVNRVRFKSKRLTSKPDRGVVVTEHEVVTCKGEVAIAYDAVRMIRTREFVETDAVTANAARKLPQST